MNSVFGRELYKLRKNLERLEKVFREHVVEKEREEFFGGIMWELGDPIEVSPNGGGNEVPPCLDGTS